MTNEKPRIHRLTIAKYKREIELAKTPEQLTTLLKMSRSKTARSSFAANGLCRLGN